MTWIKKTIPALAADLIAFAMIFWLLPSLSAQFQDLSFINSVLIGLFFALFCLSVFGLKKLRPPSPQRVTLDSLVVRRQILAVLGVLFALCTTLATAYVAGFLDSVVAINRGLLDEPSVTIYLLLTPASWFGLALIYMLVLSSEAEATVEPSTLRYGFISLFGLTGVMLMGLVLTAVWQAVWARFNTVQLAAGPVILFHFTLYLLLLGPPRLIYLSRVRQFVSVLTFFPVILYLAILAAP